MSDFLSNLAARSLTSRPVVRPRLASLFEPAHGAAMGFQNPRESGKMHQGTAISGSDLEITGVEEAATGTNPRPAFKSHRKRHLSNEIEDAADGGPEDQMPSQKMMEEERPITAVSRPRALRRPSPVNNIYGLEGTRRQEVVPAAEAREGRLTELQAMEVTKISRYPSVQRPQFLPEPSLLLLPGAAQVVASERARTGRPSSGFQEANAKHNSADMPTASSQCSLQERKPAARPLIESGPTIHVTIGRVEVRAEMAGASSRRVERQASPVMGLEEYLRRRAKRGGE